MDDNNERRPMLKSIDNSEEAFVTFINTTACTVDVVWINYVGQAVRYISLKPFGRCPINTFVTHPWIFFEKESRDRFMVEGKDVYMPRSVRSAENMLMDLTQHRVNVFITIPIYTLRSISMKVIKRHLHHQNDAFMLDIPMSLQYELAMILPRKYDPQTP